MATPCRSGLVGKQLCFLWLSLHVTICYLDLYSKEDSEHYPTEAGPLWTSDAAMRNYPMDQTTANEINLAVDKTLLTSSHDHCLSGDKPRLTDKYDEDSESEAESDVDF